MEDFFVAGIGHSAPKITPYQRKGKYVKQAEKLIEKAMRELKSTLYEYVYALDVFAFVPVRERIELSTDGLHIFYNPNQLINEYRKDGRKLGICIAHMMLHGLLGHFEEIARFQHPRLAGVIMDAQIEKLLNKMGLINWHQGRHDEADYYDLHERIMQEDFQGFSAYYESLKYKRLRKFWLGHENILKKDDHDFWNCDLVGELHGKSLCIGIVLNEDKTNSSDGKDDNSQKNGVEKQLLEKTWGMARALIFGLDSIDGAEQCAYRLCEKAMNGYNCGAGGMSMWISSLDTERSYKDILKEFLKEKEQCAEDVDTIDAMLYTYGMELYGDVMLVEPREVNDTLQLHHLFIAIDTSGSCSGDVAGHFVGEIYNIFREIREGIQFEGIHFIQCDCVIQKEKDFTDIDELESMEEELKQLDGWGGTSFVPVFDRIGERIERDGIEVDALIYLTDADGDFPSYQPEYPVFFAMPSDAFNRDNQPYNLDIPDWITCMNLGEE